MGNGDLTGLARLAAAFRNSMAGLRAIWRGEEAFRLECGVFVLCVPAALWLGGDMFTTALLIGSVLLVLVVEVLNSAIEAAIDRIGKERHELSRLAKDFGSLAVLLAAVVPALLWLAALYRKLAG